MSSQRESTKCTLACEYCRIKKAKCSGTFPCGNCTDHNEVCVFPERRTRSKKRKEREQEMEDRLARMEDLLRAAAGATTQRRHSVATADDGSVTSRARMSPGIVLLDPMDSPQMQMPEADSQIILPSPGTELPSVFPQVSHVSPVADMCSDTVPNHVAESLQQQDTCAPAAMRLPASPPSTIPVDNCSPQSSFTDLESNPGRGSCFSICALPAIEWISRQAGMSDFLASARRLSKAVLEGERLDRVVHPVRAPEPDLNRALELSKGYFEGCLDSIYEITDRHDFERRLRAHHGTDPASTSDKQWYALRNIIYASGCRYLLSKSSTPDAFSEARAQSWKYFENALSAHTDLLYRQTDMVSIQALVLMAFHAEAWGTPALEYMLLSSATRLAQSKGFHLAVSPSLNLSADEAIARQRLWWTLYAYEKHLAHRSGHPSAIDDDYVSCPVPKKWKGGNAQSFDFFTKTVTIAQISSAVVKQLNTSKAIKDSPETTLAIVQELDGRLRKWRESLHDAYRTSPYFRTEELPPGVQVFHVLYFHFSYYVLLIAIHGVFCYPWNRPDLQNSKKPGIHAQIQRSTEVVADASRQIILAVQRVEIHASLPVWLTFYFPLVGLINMFVCILKDPLASTAASDLALMDIVVGHFGYLEFISSSEFETSFPREVTTYARNLVKRAKSSTGEQQSSRHLDATTQVQGALPSTDLNTLDMALGLEDWCTFMPSIPDINAFPLDGDFQGVDSQMLPFE
ncbi:hypothetical protein NM208_g1363 [Fusarium decemcellulare]|uniref:Uncharacterized protein n=1 Tax=Fusarium decemcellulare TaxID=57161 RepID=A0ACC1SWD4_9HYPO|nr:hypothetical protein NM208_g1363 [Fusarium decemcellulare]